MKELLRKYRDVIPYAVFGVLTTLVNIVVYWLLARIFRLPTLASTVVAWILSVLFAYVTNRKWVFKSAAKTRAEITREMISFFAARLATGVIDWVGMWFLVDQLHFDDLIIKIVLNIIVVVLNYIASKLLIFKKKSEK